MNIFVWEYVCGGGWPLGPLSRSLAIEGGAMLRALCTDLSRLPNVDVTTTLDTRCPLDLPSGIRVVSVDAPIHRRDGLHRLALAADAVFVIAPELENTLAQHVCELREAGANVIAPSDGWLEQCSDKRRLSLPGVSMIPTFPLEQHTLHRLTSEWAVIKPAFGAGSQNVSVVPTGDVEKLRTPPMASSVTPPLQPLIVQPFVPGTAVSVGSVANGRGDRTIFPIAQQKLSDDGHLQYQGGSMPWAGPAVESLQQIVQRCHDLMSELAGYVGFDFVVPEADPDEPLLVEINPRLCTSYLGYRRLTDENLAAHMLPTRPKPPIRWKQQTVRFQPDGSFQQPDGSFQIVP